jgi:hypothetical protein
MPANSNTLTHEEIDFLMKNYNKLPHEEIEKRLCRKWSTIKTYVKILRKMGVPIPYRSRATDEACQIQQATYEIDDFTAGYITGLLEGEGFITFCKKGSPQKYRTKHAMCSPLIGITNTRRELLEAVQKKSGLGYIIEFKRKDGKRNHFAWLITDVPSVYKLLLKIRDHLIIKRRQAELMIKYIELWRKKNLGEYIPDATLDEIIDKVHEANMKGRKTKMLPLNH